MPLHEKWITKFSLKGKTWVFVPNDESITFGAALKQAIEEHWKIPHNYYHFKEGGHVAALRQHIHNSFFLRLDIDNFFGQINRSRITRNLNTFCTYANARQYAIESTVRDPDSKEAKYILPFGFVQSPILASLCLRKSALGGYLSSLSKQPNIVCNVYMDDILISGNDSKKLEDIGGQLEIDASRSRFPLSKTKREGPSESVTAFNVTITQGVLNITQTRMTEFETAFRESNNENQRNGILRYIESVNPSQSASLGA
jgi:hypothetical protein